MDPTRFDSLARAFAAPKSRRSLLGSVAALGAGLLGARAAGAQVAQAQCGNRVCASNPGVCTNGCVCCVYGNGNSRCQPPGTCAGTVTSPTTTTTTTTAAPTATTTTTAGPAATTTTTALPPSTCGGTACLPGQNACLANNSCAETCGPSNPANTCPLGCACGTVTTEGTHHCIAATGGGCAAVPVACTSTAGCPQGQNCQVVPCGPGGIDVGRCVALCPTT